jgi:hypothetical protein
MNDEILAPRSNDDSPRPLCRQVTWQGAAGQREVSVPLVYLPVEIDLGPDFPEPVRFDEVKLTLSYRGLMPHSSYDYLRALSGDLPYQMAIERLFVASSPVAVRNESRAKWIAAGAAVAAGLLAVWLFVGNPGRPEPLKELIESFDEPVIVDADPDDSLESPTEEPGQELPETMLDDAAAHG